MKFTQTGDKHLWIWEREKWTQSFWATEGTVDGQPVWLVTIPLSIRIPRAAREEIIGQLQKASMSADGYVFFIPDDLWKSMGRPVYGTNPTWWNRHAKMDPKKPESMEVVSKPNGDEEGPLHSGVEDDLFVKAAWKRSQVADLKTFRLVWLAITQEMPRRLVADMKPIDLGWAKLHAFPYRKNWKQIVLSRFPNAIEQLPAATNDRAGKHEAVMQTELPAHLRNTVLNALDPGDKDSGQYKFRWTLEVEESKAFVEWAKEFETDRHATLKRSDYAKQWGAVIARQFPQIVDVFTSFVRQTVFPAAMLGGAVDKNLGCLVPYIANKRVRPVMVDAVEVDPVTQSAGELCDDRGGRLVVAQGKNLSKLPVLRKVHQYMREAGGSPAGFIREPGAEDRLLVLDTVSRQGQTQDVLEAVSRGDDGLERAVSQANGKTELNVTPG
jgi:hypothetical protein